MTCLPNSPGRRACVLALMLAPTLVGCQAGVMIGRVIFGDSKIPPALTQACGIELEEQTHKVHLACTAPATVLNEYDALQLDLVSEIARRLRKREVPVTPPDDVAELIDEMGGRFDPRELASQFDDGLFIHINLERFSLREASSTELHRGTAIGEVVAMEIRSEEDERGAGVVEVYRQEIRVEYPSTHPVPRDQMSATMFKRKFLSKLSDEIGRRLYTFRVSETF